jgi:hypothetical protein
MISNFLSKLVIIPTKPKTVRSPQWPAIRKKWLQLHNICESCGTNKNLEVHHKIPVHVNPFLELELSNFITLCEYPAHHCHFTFGHFFNWTLYNPAIDTDATAWFAKLSDAAHGGGE